MVEGWWVGRGTYLGTNKEAFGAEVFAILRAVRFLSKRGEEGKTYTIFSDSRAAVARIQHDDCGPTQALARAVIDTTYELRQRGCSVSVPWTPAHRVIEGNKHADAVAKRAAEGEEDRADPEYLGEARLSHLTRKTTEARSRATRECMRDHVRRERRYRPPPGRKLHRGLGKVRKELAGRSYQLPSGHAVTASHLRRVGQAPNDRCWCGSGERQSRQHLFIKCWRWTPGIQRLWGRVKKGCERESPRAPSVRLLFRDERATPAMLEFLEETRVGKMLGLALMGLAEEESDLDEIELWPEVEEGSDEDGEESGPGPP